FRVTKPPNQARELGPPTLASGGCEPPGTASHRGVHTPRTPTPSGSFVEDAGAEGAGSFRRLSGRLLGRSAGLAFDDVGGVGELDHLVGAGRVDGTAACREPLRQVAQLGLPRLGRRVLGADLHELPA